MNILLKHKAKGNRQKANLRGSDYRLLTYLAYFRLLNPTLHIGDEKGRIMRLRSSGGQTSDRIQCSGDPQALQQTAGALVLMSLWQFMLGQYGSKFRLLAVHPISTPRLPADFGKRFGKKDSLPSILTPYQTCPSIPRLKPKTALLDSN
jgi:hypothetical protein